MAYYSYLRSDYNNKTKHNYSHKDRNEKWSADNIQSRKS